MSARLSHIALFVPDLRAAEAYYARLFAMTVITREAPRPDGRWHQLPRDRGWDDAAAAGIEMGMTALRRDDLVLALFAGDPQPGQIFLIGLQLPPAEVAAVLGRLGEDEVVTDSGGAQVTFVDRYRFMWQLGPTGDAFVGNGDTRGQWLEV